MAYWTFPTNRQGWGADDSVWTDEQGHPAGCIIGEQSHSGSSVSVTPASPCSFWARIVWDSEDELETPVDIGVGLIANDDLCNISGSRTISTLPYDSGWFKVSGFCADTGTITDLGLVIDESMSDWPGTVYFDSIYVAETEPEETPTARFYQGTNSLTERFEMPFAEVSAPSLALRQDGAVVIGNGAGDEETLVIVVFSANYTTFDNQTYGHAAEGINRMLWVK